MKWKLIIGYDGVYKISTTGIVQSTKGNGTYGGILASKKEKTGYVRVALSKNHVSRLFYVHRLVAITFIANPKKYPHVNHINGKKDDNRAENLEWCDRIGNAYHARHVLNTYKIRAAHGRAKLTEKDVAFIRNKLKKYQYGMYSALGRKFGVYASTIIEINKGKLWPTYKTQLP